MMKHYFKNCGLEKDKNTKICFHYLRLDGVNDRDDHQGNLQHQEHGDDHRRHRGDAVQVPHLRLLEQPNYQVCQDVRIIFQV